MKKLMKLLISIAAIAFCGVEAYALDARKVTSCHGTEPFWGIEFKKDKVQFKSANGHTMTIAHQTSSTAVGIRPDAIAFYQGKLQENSQRYMNIIIKRIECSDNMSDENYPFEVFVLSGNTLFFGCCR